MKNAAVNGGGREAGLARSIATRRADRAEGLAYARAWRARTRPEFDALFAEPRCTLCGGLIDER